MGMLSLLSCACPMARFVLWGMLTCHPPLIWVGVVLLRAMYGMPVRTFCPESTQNPPSCYVGTSMHALASVYLPCMATLTPPVCRVITLFVRGVSGCCLSVHNCHCDCSMARVMMIVVLVHVSSIMGVALPITCLFVVHLVHFLSCRP